MPRRRHPWRTYHQLTCHTWKCEGMFWTYGARQFCDECLGVFGGRKYVQASPRLPGPEYLERLIQKEQRKRFVGHLCRGSETPQSEVAA